MKRAKKVKTVPACTANNNGQSGHSKSVQPKGKRRVSTSVAMIGLAISMGVPNVLLTGQSDQAPAAEPVGNEPMFSTVPATTEVSVAESPSGGDLRKRSSPEGSSELSKRAESLSGGDLRKRSSPEGSSELSNRALSQLSEKEQTDATASTTQSVEITPANSQTRKPDLQPGEVLETSSTNVVASIKEFGTIEKLSESNVAKPNQLTQTAATAANQQHGDALTVAREVASISNRLKYSLAESKSEESNNQKSESVEPFSAIEKVQTNRVSLTPMVAGSTQTINQVNTNPAAVLESSARNADSYNGTDRSNEQPRQLHPSILATVLLKSSELPSGEIRLRRKPHLSLSAATLGQKQVALLSPQVNISNSTIGKSQEKLKNTAIVVSDVPTSQGYPKQIGTTQQHPTAESLSGGDLRKRSSPEGISELSKTAESLSGGLLRSELSKRAVATLGQKQVALLSPQAVMNKSAILDDQRLQEMPSRAEGLSGRDNSSKLSKTDELTVLDATLPEYQVKAGDTLTAIARNYGISVSELANANGLTDPDQLQINQQIRIPVFQYSNATGQTIAVIRSSDTVATAKTASSTQTVTVIPPLSPVVLESYNRNDATRVENGELLQTHAELVAYNPAEETQGNLATPTVPPAGTPVADAAYSGMGGSISDEADELGQTTANDQQESTAAKQSPANPYFQNLQADVQRLQQKYYAPPVNQAQQLVIQTQPIAAPVQDQGPAKARVATAPMDIEPSSSLRSITGTGQQVSPDLPPLAPGDNYLPKPFDTSVPFKGYIWPTKGILTSGYGMRWGRMHRGVDIAAPMGTPVFAAAAGVVIRAGWNSGGYGNVVDVQHADGSFTRYAHNKKLLVQAGQQVQQGQQISEMGSTGFSTGPHCHFEVHPQGKAAVNPIAFLPGVNKLSRF